MANPEHLAILKQGVTGWNEWRRKNLKTIPDLTETNLSGIDLSAANLSQAGFYKTDLSKAELSQANLNGAFLEKVNLSEAILNEATLIGAYPIEANFCEAVLIKATFSETHLHWADLSKATFAWTILADVDLSNVKGLEIVNHVAPSELSISTIYKSGGKIPEVFLRGCGVPDTMITYMASLVGKPIQFYSAFISFSSKDDGFAKRLHADLQAKGVRVWFAPEDLKIGDKLRAHIDEAIRVYDKLMVVLSENSINSAWVEKEVEAAFDKEQREKRTVLFPIRLDEAVMNTDQAWAEDIRRTRHIGDFCQWKNHDDYQKAFERLLCDLQA